MQSLILLGWLGASVAATEPVLIEVPTHTLAPTATAKARLVNTDAHERATHAMTASVGRDGRVHYDCQSAADTGDLRVDARATREEK